MIKNYFKIAWRNLIKNKVSSFINITGLAVGLATSIIIMLVVFNEFSYDKFNTNLKDIYLLMKNQKRTDDISTGESTAGPMASALRNEMPETKYASRIAYFDNAIIKVDDKVIYESGIYAEPDIFNIMTFPAIEGSPIAALQDPGTVVITASTAKKLFGNVNALGRVITLDAKNSFKVGAIVRDIPSNSTLKFDMVFPFSFFAKENDWLNKWDDNRIQTWVQLKPSANLTSLNKRLTKLLQTRSNDNTVSLFLYPLADLKLHGRFSNGKPDGGDISFVILLISLGAFVLLIACINFMNIATARSERRSREVGVRKVLGASRKIIVYQFLSEAILMSFIALALGLFLADITLPIFNRLANENISFYFFDYKIWLFLIAIGLITGFIAGSYPAFFLSRFKTIKVLKGTSLDEKRGAGLRKVLVTVQFIISIFFIIGTIVIYKQINYVKDRPVGYDQENLVDISANGELPAHFDIFKNELSKIPGVVNVAAGNDNVVQFGGSVTGMDYPGKIPGQEISVIVSSVSYNWTKTMGIKMLEGRDFNPAFATDTNACIINEAAIKKMGLKKPVLGDKIGGSTVIGVYKDFVYNNPSGIIAPMVISLNASGFSHFFVRIQNDNHWRQTLAQIEKVTKQINPDFPFDYSFLKDNYLQRFEEWNSLEFMATLFGGMAIFIACLGLFGLSSFVAEQRGKEVSIRKVFGASAKNIWVLLSRDFLKPVFIALLIVVPVSAWAASAFLSGITYHTRLSWWMFAFAGFITLFIAIATVSFQAIKAAVTNPAKSLRTE